MDYPAVSYRNQQYSELPPGAVYSGQFFFGIIIKINLFFDNSNCSSILKAIKTHKLFKYF